MGATLSSIIGLFDGSPMRGLAVGLWVGTSGVGIALGPVIGGILLQRFAWDGVFWVCAVIGMLAICAAFLCLFGFIFLTTNGSRRCVGVRRSRWRLPHCRSRPSWPQASPSSRDRHRHTDDGRAGQRGRHGQCRQRHDPRTQWHARRRHHGVAADRYVHHRPDGRAARILPAPGHPWRIQGIRDGCRIHFRLPAGHPAQIAG